MASELVYLFEQIAREKGIEKSILARVVESALISASRKNFGINNLPIQVEESENTVKFICRKKVVKEPRIRLLEISLEDAKKVNPEIKLDDIISIDLDLKDFGRNAAQTAKQVIMQKLREAEREIVYKEFKEKEGQIISGVIHQKDNKDYIINIGKIEGVLPKREQVPCENYSIGDHMKFYVLQVSITSKGSKVILSRAHNDFLYKLFEQEIPEMAEKIISIKAVAREPGQRSKVAVLSTDRNIDSVGTCVGIKGSRVHSIIYELGGEKIDIIQWSSDPKIFITNALNPAKISSVILDEKNKIAMIIVPRSQLSLAIGKHGQNARLTAKLTNWKVDVKTEEEIKNKSE
ncbi:MAG: transcription termination/antitermination protein NusA [Candidatus Firestonebacteria bacterium]|nr:transcription termination/antitermination protein NusA [Candidatus Firestonebacteria bacterium]